MAKFEKRMRAIRLRRRGYSINRIAKILEVSKSSASSWCLGVSLSEKQKKLLEANAIKSGMKGRLMGATTNHNKKLNAIKVNLEKARKLISVISERDLLLSGTALYWAEGSKSDSSSGFSFMNSDPKMILFMKIFLNKVIKVKNEDVTCTVQINAIHKQRIDEILKFWSILLELPLEQFKRPYYINVVSKKVYENYDRYYGVLRLKVKRSSNLKYLMLGLIEELCRRSSGS